MIPTQLSFRYEFTLVPSCGSVFVYMIPAQNLIPERVIPVRVHTGASSYRLLYWSEIFTPVRKLVLVMYCKRGTTVRSGVKSLSRESGTTSACVCLFNHTSAKI